MKIELKEITIGELVDKYQNNHENGVIGYGGRLDIRPPYQREFVYKPAQQEAVIETVTNNYPLNVMYWATKENGNFELINTKQVVKKEGGSFEVIDGQQRTLSICSYVNGDFSYKNLYFQNLPKDKQQNLLNYKLTIYICTGTDSEKLKWFETINIAGEKIEEFIDRGGAITLDAAARRAAEGGGQALLMKALDKGKLAAAQKAAISKSDSELIRTLTLANEGGLVLDPVMFSRTAARKGAMKVAGGSKEFHDYASIVNEPRILKLAKEDIGIEGALNNNAFITRRLELGEAYRDVAKVSPAAESAVNEWKRMNDLARDAFRRVQSKADTEALDAARAYKEKANAAFDTMVTEAKKLPGGDDLILRLRDAQKKIAKTYAIEAATNTATGRIDNAQVWGFMWDQKIPFDGNMETLARLARSMPEVMADTSKISIGKTLPQGKMAAAVAMTGVPSAARMAMGSGPAQALTFLPSYRQGTPDVAARASRFLVSDVSERMEPQRPVPYR